MSVKINSIILPGWELTSDHRDKAEKYSNPF